MVSQQPNIMQYKHPVERSRNRGSSNRASASLALLAENVLIPRKIVLSAHTAHENEPVKISLHFTEIIGKGTFGQIEKASLTIVSEDKDKQPQQPSDPDKSCKPGETGALQVAVKRVLQDPRYKNRELGIMQKLGNHPNIVQFYYYYYSSTALGGAKGAGSSSNPVGSSESSPQLFLHLILECFPGSLCDLIYHYSQQNGSPIPATTVKLFTYQMLKALAYLHSHRICHRDIKSSNLLVNEPSLVLKVCDFGSAKEMAPGTPNVSYISSRYYRAPELLFGAQSYTCAIDTWSAGCVLAEMLRQSCLFTGTDSVDQLVKVIRVLGTPTADDIASMNPVYETYCFPDVRSCPVKLFFPHGTPADMLALMCQMLVYNPTKRILPKAALSHSCFDSLRPEQAAAAGSQTGGGSFVRTPARMFDPNPPTPAHVASTVEAGLGGIQSAAGTKKEAVDPKKAPKADKSKKEGTTEEADHAGEGIITDLDHGSGAQNEENKSASNSVKESSNNN